jgi:hypothetical protein
MDGWILGIAEFRFSFPSLELDRFVMKLAPTHALMTLLLISVWFGAGSVPTALAQNPTAPGAKKEVEIPKPEDVTLKTSDGFDIRCTYFKPVYNPETEEPGKTTLPFILLHDWERDRRDFYTFALQLQKAGCAVIVPDLRGHGESAQQGDAVLDLKKFRKLELANMVNDIEACKKFLVQRNNDAELNVDLLNVVAIGQTNVLAMNWIIYQDWYGYPPYRGNIKQGQDVKSLTMIAPVKKLGQINMNQELKHPMFSGRNPQMPNLPTLVIWAENESATTKDSISIFETMRKGRPDSEKVKDAIERAELETVREIVLPRSNLSGTEMINQNEGIRIDIMRFVASKVGAKLDQHPWQSRAAKQ